VEGYRICVDKKITHRDLKPANILMHDGVPKISDFGYCEVSGYPKPRLYYNVGSPCYMSPEAIISSCYGEKSDVWSLGVILY
jgi:serine/threonine protein kinase